MSFSGRPQAWEESAQDMITELRPVEIIVVGTNIRGMHGAGAAAYAQQNFGLRPGIGEGLSGRTYALPTMEGYEALAAAAERFLAYARLSHDLLFLMTRIGCGIAGHAEKDVAPLFRDAPANVLLPPGWDELSQKTEPDEADR